VGLVSSAQIEAHSLLASSQPEEDRLTDACLAELFLTDPVDDRAKLATEKGERVPGTCKWILTHDTYKAWLSAPSQLLWLSAGPGHGKTMLSVFLTEELEKLVRLQQDALLAYFFCDNRDNKRNSAVAVLRGFILQLLRQRSKLFEHILPVYRVQGNDLFSSFESLWRVFEGMVHETGLTRVFCVIDGLDECDEPSLDMLVRKFQTFFSKSPRTFKLIAVSREKPDCLPWAFSGFSRIRLAPDLDAQVENDLERFVTYMVEELARKKSYSEDLRTRMVSTLIERASGMFLWVSFVVAELRNRSIVEVEDTLNRLPVGLAGIYDRMLLQVSQDRRDMVRSILRWVALALRPLTLSELATAIDIEPVAELDIEETTRQYVGFCGYFLTVTGDRVGLVHQSAKDYLLRHGSLDDGPLRYYYIKEGEANAEIARTCYTYLNNGALENLRYDPWDSNEESRLRLRFKSFSLLDYALRYWIDHARKASTSAEVIYNLSHPFYAIGSPTREAWFMIYTHIHLANYEAMPDSLIHFASRLGLDQLVLRVLENGKWRIALRRSVVDDEKFGRKPLYYAAKYGHVGVLELLLKHKANVNGRTRDGSTALHTAARFGRGNIVRLLLANHVDIHATNRDGETALHIAAEGGHSNIVQILLEQGAVVDAKDSADRTAFLVAARYDAIPVMQMLLEHHANVDIKDEYGMTALHRAATGGYSSIPVMKMLLEHHPDLDIKDQHGMTVLHRAAKKGDNFAAKTFLDHLADI
jgi:hypothetical protein